jgi:site-specific DNA recombinase
MTRAIIYARVSTDDTGKDSRNIDGQIAECLDYCQQKGYQVIAQLKEDDKGASGAETDLPQLNFIRDMAHNGEFDILVVREIDRLSRSHEKYYVLKYQLLRHDVSIEYVIGDYDDSFAGKILESFTVHMAEEEREQIKRRLLRGKRNKIKAGSVMVSVMRPFGYRVVKDDNGMDLLVIDETEAKIVKQVFNWYLEAKSRKWIARKLSEMSVPTVCDTLPKSHKKRGYGQWVDSSVRQILEYETYATGQWVYGKSKMVEDKRIRGNTDNVLTVTVPTIINCEIFDKAQKQAEINSQNSSRNRKHNYLMARRVKCGHCNGSMIGTCFPRKRKTKTSYYYYYIDHAAKPGHRVELCDNKHYWSVKKIDSYVWDWIVSLCSDPDVLKEKLFEQLQHEKDETGPLREQLEIARDLITEHTDRLNELIQNLNLFKDSKRAERTKEAIAKEIKQEETTLDKLETEASKLEKQIASQSRLTEDSIKDIMCLMATFGTKLQRVKTFEDKRTIIEALDVRITVWADGEARLCKIVCMVGENVFNVASNRSKRVAYISEHIESIMITHTFNINAIAA